MTAFLASFFFVVLAEMGDKTQLLAMAFATRYSAWKVLTAVFLATVINHGLAVAVGHYLTVIIPLEIISLAAAFSFILFGLWTIRGDTLENEDKKESRFGPIVTVGVAFFLAEMGDKTQLATISLAVEYQNMAGVLMGTTLGMITADAIGIVIGIVLRKHIPEKTIKWISAVIFVLFGLSGIYKIIAQRLPPLLTLSILLAISAATAYAAYRIKSKQPSSR
ncbi:MAG TPA: TMEM165/GDT1 family protein [Candidatus Omnitrophota bacterium]|nr:TMEM165/GDT1 family protein [Candidatus Omnitrophota bacterium]HRZ14341.1 TMEM165/GDT1 family protein [Candidatus Omnitrophota bacterium]